jgi:hypothetical protein
MRITSAIVTSHVAVVLGAAAMVLVMSARPAQPHDWYPLACCSGIDCGPVEPAEVKAVNGGWFIPATGEFIPFDKAQISPDGGFHRCTMKAHDPKSKTRCLFVPGMGS